METSSIALSPDKYLIVDPANIVSYERNKCYLLSEGREVYHGEPGRRIAVIFDDGHVKEIDSPSGEILEYRILNYGHVRVNGDRHGCLITHEPKAVTVI